jgi:hypothetical protein
MDDITEITLEQLKELIENSTEEHYGLPVIEYDGCEYAIAIDDEEADKACYEYIEGSVWAFSPFFLEQMTDVPAEMFEAIQDKCDSINEALQILVMRTCGMQDFVDQAISWDGRGHFLSPWDGKEIELECGTFAYRIN